MITVQRFWDAARPLIDTTAQHPFLRAMVEGTLPARQFHYYVYQDALYLHDFAACLHRLADHATELGYTPEATTLRQLAHTALQDEFALHTAYFQHWKKEDDEDVRVRYGQQQMPMTLLYTSYMTRIVNGGSYSYGEGLAALLPCFWVYRHVGQGLLQLRTRLDTDTTPTTTSRRSKQYDAWIDMYAGDDFATEVTKYIAIVNKELERIQQPQSQSHTNHATTTNPPTVLEDAQQAYEEEIQKMEDHFLMNCKLEHMFWDQAVDLLEWPTIGGM